MKRQITPTQEKVLAFIKEKKKYHKEINHQGYSGVSAWEVARHLWPDNKLWEPGRRVGRNKSLPGWSVLLMKAGTILRRMQNKALITTHYQSDRHFVLKGDL